MMRKAGILSLGGSVALNTVALILLASGRFDRLEIFFAPSSWLVANIVGSAHDSLLGAFLYAPLVCLVNVLLVSVIFFLCTIVLRSVRRRVAQVRPADF